MIGFGFWSSSGTYNSYGIYDRVFGLISSSLRKKQLRVVLDGKSRQEYPVNVGVPQGSIMILHISRYTSMTFQIMSSVIALSVLIIWVALRNLVSHVQFKKGEKDTWKSVAFSKVLKLALLHGCFFTFLKLYNCFKIE